LSHRVIVVLVDSVVKQGTRQRTVQLNVKPNDRMQRLLLSECVINVLSYWLIAIEVAETDAGERLVLDARRCAVRRLGCLRRHVLHRVHSQPHVHQCGQVRLHPGIPSGCSPRISFMAANDINLSRGVYPKSSLDSILPGPVI